MEERTMSNEKSVPNPDQLQKQINDLVEKRLNKVQELKGLESDKKELADDIKTVKNGLDAYDKVLQEKLDIMRGKNK